MLQEGAHEQRTAAEVEAAAMASTRARMRSDNAALVAVGRLRAPQSVFNPLHRTPTRPEMRRSITHGRFSPVGRKLWRQSEGLSPRTGQLCLSPRRRELGTEGFGAFSPSGGGGREGCGTLDVTAWTELPPPLAIHQEESHWGFASDTDVDTTGCCHDEEDAKKDQLENRGHHVADGSSAGRRHPNKMQRQEEEEAEEETRAVEGKEGVKAVEEGDKGLPYVNSVGADGDFRPQEEDGIVVVEEGDKGLPFVNSVDADDGFHPQKEDGIVAVEEVDEGLPYVNGVDGDDDVHQQEEDCTAVAIKEEADTGLSAVYGVDGDGSFNPQEEDGTAVAIIEEADKGLRPVKGVDGDGRFHQQQEADMQVREERGDGPEATAAPEAAAAAGDEDDAVSKADRRYDEGARYVECAGATTNCGGPDNLEDGGGEAEPVATAGGDPDPRPPSTTTRCLSYTVTIPWDGHK